VKKWFSLSVLMSIVMASSAARASEYYVNVTDMSQLSWQLDPTGTVWLRNLDSFDSSVIHGNYNFSLDTTTNAGKSLWAAMLAKIESAQPLWIGLSNGNSAAGAVNYAGNW
jgi:hypothetical protein